MSDYKIIDCHIHPAVDALTGCNWYGRYATFAAQKEALLRAGIARVCGAPIRRLSGQEFAPIRELNDLALALRDREPDFYVPGITVHPHFPAESCREIERCRAAGARWVGELVGYFMGYGDEYATPGALEVMACAEEHSCVVNIHCGDITVVEALCSAAPGLPVVLAHPGEGQKLAERLDAVARHRNLYLDLSGTGIDRLGMLAFCVEKAGAKKILFGSDFPVNNPAVYVHGALYEQLSPADYALIFSGNFLRLIGEEK